MMFVPKNKTVPWILGALVGLGIACGEDPAFQSVGMPGSKTDDLGMLFDKSDGKYFSQEYRVAKSKFRSFDLSGYNKTVPFDIKMNATKNWIEDSFKVPTRLEQQAEFQQGSYGKSYEETLSFSEKGVADVLVVLDTSTSMKEENKKVSFSLPHLLKAINKTNWRVALTTMDEADPCVEIVLDHEDPHAEQRFRDAISNKMMQGSHKEKGFLKAVQALEAQCLDKPWLRKNSSLAVIFVSDEDNCSLNGRDCWGEEWSKASYFTDYLASIRELRQDARAYGIIWKPQDSFWKCSTGEQQGLQYTEAVQKTDGLLGSICDRDYKDLFQQISSDIASYVKSDFELKYAPTMAEVYYRNSQLGSDEFDIVDNIIHFKNGIPFGQSFKIIYRHGSNTIRQNFNTNERMDPETVRAFVNNQPVQDISVSNGIIQFHTPPEEHAKIRIQYKKDEAQTLKVPTGIQDLEIYLEDELVSQGFEYQSSKGMIELDPEFFEEGKNLRIKGFHIEPILNYKIGEQVKDPDWVSITLFDAATGQDIVAELGPQGDFVLFNQAEFIQGREIRGTLHASRQLNSELDLPRLYDHLQVRVDGELCENTQIEGQRLRIGCTTGDEHDVIVSYKEIYDYQDAFFVGPELDQVKRKYISVKINNKETNSFETTADSIKILEPLGYEDSVTIEISDEGILATKADHF